KGKLDIYPGIRWESTQQEISGSVNPLPGVGPDVSIVYNDYLPSVHLNYFLSESWQIKAAYFKGIARPSLYDLSFYSINYE
ncbi:TonB-dependent receptor, partial [Acinetobacter baumannii]